MSTSILNDIRNEVEEITEQDQVPEPDYTDVFDPWAALDSDGLVFTDDGTFYNAGWYESSQRRAFGSQQEVADAWAMGRVPVHNADSRQAVVYTGQTMTRAFPVGRDANFHGIHYPDGRGELRHYSTREAIRTRTGLIVTNSQCWSAGFAHCSVPTERSCGKRSVSAPLDSLESLLEHGESVYDIRSVEVSEERNGGRLIHFAQGFAIYDGFDASAGRHGNRHYLIRLEAHEVGVIEDPSEIPEVFLTPDEVKRSALPVVHSGEYSRTRFHNPDPDEIDFSLFDEVKVTGGWNGHFSVRGYINSRFRPDWVGNCIVRQGEWFFIPDLEFEPTGPIYKGQTGKWDVRHLGEFTARNDLPRQCGECQATSFLITGAEFGGDDFFKCRECGKVWIPDRLLNEDELRWVLSHSEREDAHLKAASAAYKHSQKLGSHSPRDVGARVVMADGGDEKSWEVDLRVRGTVIHVDRDHDACNLLDGWHLSLTHDRDALSRPESSGGPTGRGRGGWD